MSPSGDVALQQRNLIINALVLMLIIIVPVIALTLFFAWRYRASAKATYAPEWDHSVMLELLIWSAPLLIIIALGALTWVSTHKLDPYRSLDRLSAGRPIPAEVKPLVVDVVTLDWKWLFIYPEQGIATVNEMAAPVDRPIEFKITSSTMMNSFFVPALAGQIYAMPGMETQLHAVMNKQGQFEGFSANYSGAGFSYMRFAFHSLSADAFDQWVAQARQSGDKLDRESYNALAKPSTNDPVRHYASVAPGLYEAILNLCTDPQRQCVSDMMHMGEMRQSGKSGDEHRMDAPGAAQ
ncbi:hypothetical protein DYGSA30_33660 [Dyella sp. GSA-30]|nr:hypothetical protein DYGSA30_33660 [Dyella sp. GSA-30]